jgi:hypothetical protein
MLFFSKNAGRFSYSKVLINAVAVSCLCLVGCKKGDTTSMAVKPSDMFVTNPRERCLDRAAQLGELNAEQRVALCEKATSSAPVDCFKKKKTPNLSIQEAIAQCK